MGREALVIVDMQAALVGRGPCDKDSVLSAIGRLAAAFRNIGAPVIYVRHDGGSDDELQWGTPGWEICEEIAPGANEPIFDKRFNSAFRQTELHGYLEQQGVSRLVMCGMQTEFCFDVSVKVAYEIGYEVTVPRGAVTTFDCAFAKGNDLTQYFEDEIWNGRYARVLSVDEIVCALEEAGSL